MVVIIIMMDDVLFFDRLSVRRAGSGRRMKKNPKKTSRQKIEKSLVRRLSKRFSSHDVVVCSVGGEAESLLDGGRVVGSFGAREGVGVNFGDEGLEVGVDVELRVFWCSEEEDDDVGGDFRDGVVEPGEEPAVEVCFAEAPVVVMMPLLLGDVEEDGEDTAGEENCDKSGTREEFKAEEFATDTAFLGAAGVFFLI